MKGLEEGSGVEEEKEKVDEGREKGREAAPGEGTAGGRRGLVGTDDVADCVDGALIQGCIKLHIQRLSWDIYLAWILFSMVTFRPNPPSTLF